MRQWSRSRSLKRPLSVSINPRVHVRCCGVFLHIIHVLTIITGLRSEGSCDCNYVPYGNSSERRTSGDVVLSL